VSHAIPPKYQIVKPGYIKNENKLESMTTVRENYQPHLNVKPPARRQQPKWQGSSGTFSSVTTNKTDYVEFQIPTLFKRVQAPWVKSEAKLEGQSTQKDDYQKWTITNVTERKKPAPAAPPGKEDR
jgi:hypothetical protein